MLPLSPELNIPKMWNLPHEVWVHYCDIGLIAPCAQVKNPCDISPNGILKNKFNYEKNIIGSNVNPNVIDFKC